MVRVYPNLPLGSEKRRTAAACEPTYSSGVTIKDSSGFSRATNCRRPTTHSNRPLTTSQDSKKPCSNDQQEWHLSISCDGLGGVESQATPNMRPELLQRILKIVEQDMSKGRLRDSIYETHSPDISSGSEVSRAILDYSMSTTGKRKLPEVPTAGKPRKRVNLQDANRPTTRRSATPRVRTAEEEDASDDEYISKGQVLEEVSIGDTRRLEDFYSHMFRQMKQVPCKIVAKAWVKVVEPRKQTKHPYNGSKKGKIYKKEMESEGYVDINSGDVCKPEWWPKEGCRHKEPDHIYRDAERILLLIHILRNLKDSHNITCDRLEESFNLADPASLHIDHTKSARPILQEIYHVRSKEERYLRDEIDATTTILLPMPTCPTTNQRRPAKYGKKSLSARQKSRAFPPAQKSTSSSRKPQRPLGSTSPRSQILTEIQHRSRPSATPTAQLEINDEPGTQARQALANMCWADGPSNWQQASYEPVESGNYGSHSYYSHNMANNGLPDIECQPRDLSTSFVSVEPFPMSTQRNMVQTTCPERKPAINRSNWPSPSLSAFDVDPNSAYAPPPSSCNYQSSFIGTPHMFAPRQESHLGSSPRRRNQDAQTQLPFSLPHHPSPRISASFPAGPESYTRMAGTAKDASNDPDWGLSQQYHSWG